MTGGGIPGYGITYMIGSEAVGGLSCLNGVSIVQKIRCSAVLLHTLPHISCPIPTMSDFDFKS